MKYTMLQRYHLFFIWSFSFQLVFPVHVVREKFDILLDEDTCTQYRAEQEGDKCICHQTDQTVISYDAQYYVCAQQTHAGCYLYIDSLDQSGLVDTGELYKQIHPRLPDEFNFIHQVLIWNFEKYITSWYDVTESTKKFFQLMPPPPGRTEPFLAVSNINMLHWKGHLVKVRFGPPASNEPCLTLKFKGERRYPFDISEFEEAMKELPTTTKSTTTSSTTTTTTTATTTTTTTKPTTSTTTTLKTTTKSPTTTPATTSSTTTTTPTTTKTTTTTRTTASTPEAAAKTTTTTITTETSTKRSTWSKSPKGSTKKSTLSTLRRSTQNTTSVPHITTPTTQKGITPTSLSTTESRIKGKEGKLLGIIPTKIFYTIIGCVIITLILSITACSIRRRKQKLLSKRNEKYRGNRGQVYEDVTETNINKHKSTTSVDGEGYLIPNQPSCPPLDGNLYECSKSTPQTLYSDLNKFNVSVYSSFDRPPITEPCYSDLQSRDYMVLEYEDVKIEQKPSSFTEEVDYFEIEPDY